MKVIPRNDDDVKAFLLLYGHGSRLKLPFLDYVKNPKDHWVVCMKSVILQLSGKLETPKSRMEPSTLHLLLNFERKKDRFITETYQFNPTDKYCLE